jgi:serine protease AprX
MKLGKSCFGLILVIFSIIVFSLVFSTISHSKSIELSNWNDRITGSLESRIAAAGSEERIPVIITLERGASHQRIGSIASVVESMGDRIKHKYNLFPGLSAKVSKKTLQRLAQNPNIKSIEPDRRIKASADVETNIGLIRANDTWEVMFGDINATGKGMTVCVIDTGIDYTHLDLGNCTNYTFMSGDCNKTIAGFDFVNDDDDPMDDNGHGSHVAGIAAANGSGWGGLLGVAPDAKIVGIKVLDEDGGGTTSDMNKGIEWCVNNASLYNITVISMSLGVDCDDDPSGCYPSFCDGDETSTSQTINDSVAANISVVVSTGNDANYTHISFPACIEKSIRVAATDNSDVFPGGSDFSNRGAGFPDMMTAPGYSINSTVPPESACTGLPGKERCDNSRYKTLQGTSMAAPHVSGSVLLFQQSYQLIYGLMPEPSLAWSFLNRTGKQVSDSQTSIDFSRIDIYSAINVMAVPDIVIISPLNQSYANGSLDFNISVDRNLTNAVFSVNETANWSMSNGSQSFSWYNDSFPELPHGYHNVTYWVNDSFGDMNHSTIFFTVDKIPPEWTSNASSVVSTYSASQASFFNITWNDSRLDSVFIESNWSGSADNYSMYTTETGLWREYQFNATLPAGDFYLRSWCNDTAGNWNVSDAWTFSVGRENVSITLYLNSTLGNFSMVEDDWANITVLLGINSTIELSVNGSLNIYTNVKRIEKTIFPNPGLYNISAVFPGNQNYSSNSTTWWIEVNDTTSPVITNATALPTPVMNGENVTIKANVSDYSIDSMWYNISNTNNTNVSVAEGLMTNISSTYYLANYTVSLSPGTYIVTVFANDSAGNQANTSAGSFTVGLFVNFTINFFDYNNTAENITQMYIYYNGTRSIRNQTSGNASTFQDTLPIGLWDIEVIAPFNITLFNTNLSLNKSFEISMDWNIDEDRSDEPSGVRSFAEIAAINTTLDFQSSLVNMSFIVEGSENRSHVSVFACHSWNISTRICSGSWVNASSNSTFNMSSNTTSIISPRFSAFAVTQDEYCGDGTCDSSESCTSCSADCGACPSNDDTTGSSVTGASTTTINITSFPASVDVGTGGSANFQVIVENSGDRNLTGVSLTFSTNCSNCSFTKSPASMNITSGRTGTFSASISSGNQAKGQYSLGITVNSIEGASDTITSIIKLSQCTNGAKRCVVDALQECTGGEWAVVRQCEHGCQNGACNLGASSSNVCSANQTRCSSNQTVQKCKQDRSGWEFLENCTYGCEDGACKSEPPLDMTLIITIATIVIIIIVAIVVLWIYFSKRKADNVWEVLEKKYGGKLFRMFKDYEEIQ